MTVRCTTTLLEQVRQLGLLDPAQLADALNKLSRRFHEPRDLARELVRRQWLTPYQVNQLFLGRGAELLLGQYVLLERLGEGGMGMVFKARHQKLGRIVALKVIRKEHLQKREAVVRFDREVKAVAQLGHPNIIHAYDAAHLGDTHFLIMEFVEGTDLDKLVKERGPLPVALACDYARQAALGLQHAHEQGLVHRDVKPPNLLLAANGVVKVLDLGLARLVSPEAFSEQGTILTHDGAILGTPDFIAPEQARDPHAADIRADLYSLGCTLYFLLTGSVPFPGGTLTEKLLKHHLDPPEPVRRLRPAVPEAVAAVVARLMAKRPEDRYPTPADAAAALVEAIAAREPETNPFADLELDTVAVSLAQTPRRWRGGSHQRMRFFGATAGGVVLGLLAVVFWETAFAAKHPKREAVRDKPAPSRPVPVQKLQKARSGLEIHR
jgi:serine/threonine-protein kinase